MKAAEMNQELIRKRFLGVFLKYPNQEALSEMKLIVKEYDLLRELLDETLNISIGIMEAVIKKEIKDKKEEQGYINEIVKELEQKSYLSGGIK